MRLHATAATRAALAAALCTAVSAPGATVTVDPSVEYQTMLGFGGTGINGSVSDIVSDMGLSLHRAVVEPGGGAFPSFAIQRQLRNLGVNTFIAVPWSPPAGMKDNSSTTNGGSLLPQYYTAFAQHLGRYVTDFKRDVGIDLYAISPQNEPRFVEPYNSCVYTKEQYREVVATVFSGSGLKITLTDK